MCVVRRTTFIMNTLSVMIKGVGGGCPYHTQTSALGGHRMLQCVARAVVCVINRLW